MNTISRYVFTALLGVMFASLSLAQSPRIVPIAPMIQDVEVLHGDPEKAGEPFVIRIRELAGGIIPPHRHPIDEHITVVQGTVYFAVSDKYDRALLRELKAGSYAFIPKGSMMFGYTPQAAIVQVHGVGPFHIAWRTASGWDGVLKTLDSPDAVHIFKFRRGEHVVTPRGTGRIRQGYDAGEVIAYDIDGDKGEPFMAEECEIEGAGTRAPKRKPGERACFTAGEPLVPGNAKHKSH